MYTEDFLAVLHLPLPTFNLLNEAGTQQSLVIDTPLPKYVKCLGEKC